MPLTRIATVEFGMHVGMSLIWPEHFNSFNTKSLRQQFTKSWTAPPRYDAEPNLFATDGDWWAFNLATHSVFGSEAYLAARSHCHSPMISFLFAVFASFTWEYLVESWYQQPSAIDLFWTPIGGVLLGEARFLAHREAGRRISSRIGRTILLVLIDPLGELERVILDCKR